MTPVDIQVSRSKVSVEGQAYSLYVGEGGISVLQTSIFIIFMPPDRMIGAYCFCPLRLFVCLSSTLTFAITFESLKVETSYLACILY